MNRFFDGTRPGDKVEYQGRTYELPALYFRDDCFILFFSADFEAIRGLMPSDRLHPVRLPGGKAAVGFSAFNYIDTTLGPYGEIAVAIPVVHREKRPPTLLPLLSESKYPGFGLLVVHLPVTNTLARDGGRLGWNYPKFVADMEFVITPEYQEVVMSDDGQRILAMRVARRGFVRRDAKPMITYTVQNGCLVKTVIPHRGAYRQSLKPKGSFLQLGSHPVAESLRSWGISSGPLISRYYLERWAILPLGEIVEQNVRPSDGFIGQDREGIHAVRYTT